MSAEAVIQGLVARGVPLVAALGLAGNLTVESGLDPGINEIAPLVDGSRGGFGLAQWTGPRRRQFENFARQRGAALDDRDTQLDFLVWELNNTERAARDAIYSAQDPMEAARAVSERFLRPGIPHLDRRLRATAELAGRGLEQSLGGSINPLAGQAPPQPAQNALAQYLPPPQPIDNSLNASDFMRPRRQNAMLSLMPGAY